MPNYIIPVSYMMYGKYEIEADSIKDALNEVHGSTMPLPPDSEYLIDSLQIDAEDVRENNPNLNNDDLKELNARKFFNRM